MVASKIGREDEISHTCMTHGHKEIDFPAVYIVHSYEPLFYASKKKSTLQPPAPKPKHTFIFMEILQNSRTKSQWKTVGTYMYIPKYTSKT